MIFNTTWFLAFFFVFYPLLCAVPGNWARWALLLAGSAFFHFHFAGPAGVVPILFMGLTTWVLGIVLDRLPRDHPQRQRVFVVALAPPVLSLVGYKYAGMLLAGLVALLPASAAAQLPDSFAPALPLAISFFTFEFVHYLVDVRAGSAAVRSPLQFAMFAIFFPSIVSGPIKRFQPFLEQMRAGLARPGLDDFSRGLAQVLLGFAKKLVVADNAAAAIGLLEKRCDGAFAVVLLMFLLSVRILFDFSGYSDIAIGLARMIGIRLPRNFNFPYIAQNPSDFWRRWHISLSVWIRDYIYIPLGGARRGAARKGFNLAVTMFLCGLWHGASWHFGVWGLYHGLGLTAHTIFRDSALAAQWGRVPGSRWLGVVGNCIFVAYGWLFFFYPLREVLGYTRLLFGG